MGYRRLIVTVVLTAVLAALAQPLYSVGGIWTGIINSRNNKTVRLDLLKTGGKDNKDVHAPFFFRPLSGRNGKVRLLCN